MSHCPSRRHYHIALWTGSGESPTIWFCLLGNLLNIGWKGVWQPVDQLQTVDHQIDRYLPFYKLPSPSLSWLFDHLKNIIWFIADYPAINKMLSFLTKQLPFPQLEFHHSESTVQGHAPNHKPSKLFCISPHLIFDQKLYFASQILRISMPLGEHSWLCHEFQFFLHEMAFHLILS